MCQARNALRFPKCVTWVYHLLFHNFSGAGIWCFFNYAEFAPHFLPKKYPMDLVCPQQQLWHVTSVWPTRTLIVF